MIVFTNKHKIPFQIDEEDYERVSKHYWYIHRNGYPTNSSSIRGSTIYLHQFLMGDASEGLEWDHINHDKLDNRKENLRAVSHSLNLRNQKIQSSSLIQIRGVHFDYTKKKFAAQIYMDKETHKWLGRFDTLEEAVAARKAAELKYWGCSY